MCQEDTIGSAGIQGSIGGDGTDWQNGHGDDEVGHQKHGDGLVQSGLSNHEPWSGKTQTQWENDWAAGRKQNLSLSCDVSVVEEGSYSFQGRVQTDNSTEDVRIQCGRMTTKRKEELCFQFKLNNIFLNMF